MRPFAQSRRYAGADVNLQQAGRDLRTANVVTGHFRNESGKIRLTLEAIDVDDNRVLWRDSFEVPAADPLALRQGVETRIRQGLLPALGAAPGATGSQPKNARAYELYLRALAISRDAAPNRQAIAILEEVVALDPDFAPGWGHLGLRYYYDAQYGGGGPEMLARGEAATRRAAELDPDLTQATRALITLNTEEGRLNSAYDEARAFLARRPDSAESHFAMGYVLRYAGLLEEAARACDVARSLDPGNPTHRSCAWVALLQGNYERALELIQVDAGSEFANNFVAAGPAAPGTPRRGPGRMAAPASRRRTAPGRGTVPRRWKSEPERTLVGRDGAVLPAARSGAQVRARTRCSPTAGNATWPCECWRPRSPATTARRRRWTRIRCGTASATIPSSSACAGWPASARSASSPTAPRPAADRLYSPKSSRT